MSLATEFEGKIRRHRLVALESALGGGEFILPHYGGYSIANLGATIAGLFGIDGALAEAGLQPPLPPRVWEHLAPGVNCVALVVLDGVGYSTFQRLLDAGGTGFSRLTGSGVLVPLTSVFPSTTMAAMSSIWTGRAPADHGFLGRRLFLSEYGFVADMIRLMPALHGNPGSLQDWGFAPEEFIPVPHLAQLLSAAGARTAAHLYAPHVGGGLSRLFMQGVDRIEGFVNYSDMWINVRDTVAQRHAAPLLVSVYWAGTDDVAHTYGPEDERFAAAVRQISESFEHDFLASLPPEARAGTIVIVTADHGQVEVPADRAVHLSDHPSLKQMLLCPPCAEPRASYLHVRRGCKGMVRDYVAAHLADRFLVLDAEQAVSAGLFGPGDMPEPSRGRLGDLLLLAKDNSRLVVEGGSDQDRGEHGSLLPGEMLVPLLMARLDG